MKRMYFLSLIGFIALATVAKAKKIEPVETQVRKLAQDRVFSSTLRTLTQFTQRSERSWQALSPAKQKSTLKLLAEFKKQPPQTPIPSALRGVLPIQNSDLDGLRKGLQYVAQTYPSIRSTAHFGETYSSGVYESEYGFTTLDPTYCERVDCECHRECKDEYRRAYNQVGLRWFQDGIRNIADPFGFLMNMVDLATEIGALQETLADCSARCNGLPEDWECQNHGDCEETEYCAKPFGNPVNSCSIKKPDGWACSSDAKCMSGCCKYHFLTNPLQPVCRPADKCD